MKNLDADGLKALSDTVLTLKEIYELSKNKIVSRVELTNVYDGVSLSSKSEPIETIRPVFAIYSDEKYLASVEAKGLYVIEEQE